MNMYVDVLVEIKNKHVDKTFTYKVPKPLEADVEVGKRVVVPFGKMTLEGYILNRKDQSDIETKEILEVIDEEPVLNVEMMTLGTFVQEKTLASLSACYGAMLPKALKAKKSVTLSKKMVSYLKLAMGYEEIYAKLTNDSQKRILELFQQEDLVLKKEANKISASAVKTMLKKEYIEQLEQEVYRYQLKEVEKEVKKIFTPAQEKAYQKIKEELNTEKVFLLHGVTGSGKTEVYLQLIEDVLNSGKTALVLVPEISLTSQLTERFHKRFGNNIAVLHSGLSDAERYDEWRKILREEVSIVIGARSAVFAPLKNIGIIIMDEEHSESYKQENNPRYHALDIAKKRAETHHCPVILGSATPSLSSMARAIKGVYQYVPLLERANQKKLPNILIVDMALEVQNRHPILSRELECKIIEKLNKNEQVMLLLNRRGHSTTITCSNCGYTYRCPHCDISLTYHKSSNQLRCHYCGYTKYKDDRCPNCHEDALNYLGLGTEKLEEYLGNVFPTARIIRMDRDSTTTKGMHEKIITDFYDHKYDILLGTQMVSKGLDFPHVSLVGILNADASLNIPDYRSNERTFSLLCQASGRAGRKDTTGEVIIQTFYPDNFIMQCVKEQNYQKFCKYELNIRKTLKYPPFYNLCIVKIQGVDNIKCEEEANKIISYLKHNLKDEIVLGPSPSVIPKINNVYYYQIIIKYKDTKKIYNYLKYINDKYLNSKVNVGIDFNTNKKKKNMI